MKTFLIAFKHWWNSISKFHNNGIFMWAITHKLIRSLNKLILPVNKNTFHTKIYCMIFPAGCSCYGGRQHVFELATGQLLMKSCRKNRHDVMWSPHRKVFYADPRSNITTNSTISLYFLGNKLFFFCPDVKSKSPFQGAICPLTCP